MAGQTDNERLVIVLGTSHALQRAEKWERSVDDPDYIRLIEHLSSGFAVGIDCIFEEASGCGPTAAQEMAKRSGFKYLDVDPCMNDRHKYGLSKETGYPMNEPFEFAHRLMPEEHFKREDFWVDRIKNEQFQTGLVICGFVHTLTLAVRLISSGFKQVYTHCYVP